MKSEQNTYSLTDSFMFKISKKLKIYFFDINGELQV